MKKKKIGVLFGGISTEHDVSVVSGTSVIKHMDKKKYEVFPIYLSKQGEWYEYQKEISKVEILPIGDTVEPIQKIENPIAYLQELDAVFPVLHGKGGEDGTIQGLLEWIGVPYVGCGVLSSSLGMDKAYTKMVIERAQIQQAKYLYFQKRKNGFAQIHPNFEETIHNLGEICGKVEENLGYPVFVKPSNSGSSIGITKAANNKELQEAIKNACQYDTKLVIEENIDGLEVECAVLGNKEVKASSVGKILPAEEFYTFDAKYKNAQSKLEIPAKLPQGIEEQIRKMAIRAFRAVDGKGLARVDFFVRKSDSQIILNEINTMPGFTSISMYPKLWEQMGLSYTELIDTLLLLSLEEKEGERCN